MKRTIAYIATFFVCIWIATQGNEPYKDIAMGVAGGLLLFAIDFVISHAKWAKFIWWSIRYWNKHVRLSVSYLYRIKLVDDYFLLEGQRIPDQFQPVGGVYKRYPSAASLFNKLNILDDDLFSIDESSKDDLRIRVPGKHLWRWMIWFESEEDRERDFWREFEEELLSSKILPRERFPFVFCKHISRHIQGVEWSNYIQGHELLIADIVEPILNESQIKEFEKLRQKQNGGFIFATEEEMLRLGVKPKINSKANIARTAAWTI